MSFLRKLIRLVKIAFPSIFGRETLCLSSAYILMFLRTYLTIYISEVNGSIVKSIIKMDINHFIINLTTLFLVSLPSAVVNSGIEYINRMLSAFLRENLTKHLHKKFIKKMCFYQVSFDYQLILYINFIHEFLYLKYILLIDNLNNSKL